MNDHGLPAGDPLRGVRVVEIGTSVSAPYAAWILAALGADVVKVERPGSGDDARQWGRLFADGTSSTFHALNRDKRGITVDLKDEAQRRWLIDFCLSQADVVIQNLRPGRARKYGLGGARLCAENPRLIYCNLWAFGVRGPLKDRPGYDPLMQAFSGLMSVTGEEGRPPIRIGTSIVDMGAGMWCVIGILAAVHRLGATGKGSVIDTSLYETALAWMTNHTAATQVDGRNPERLGSGNRGMAPYQAYLCNDGYLVVAAPNDDLFQRLCQVLGHPEWAQDRRFESNQKRYRNLAALNALIEPVLAAHSRRHFGDKLDRAGVPNAPVRDTLEMMDDPQVSELGIMQALPGSGLRLMGLPLSFDGARPPLRRPAPAPGEHNAEIKEGEG